MALITNTGQAARGLPVSGKMVEIAPNGGQAEIDDAEWAKLKKRATVSSDLSEGILVESESALAEVVDRTAAAFGSVLDKIAGAGEATVESKPARAPRKSAKKG